MEVIWIAAGVLLGGGVVYMLALLRGRPGSIKAVESFITRREMTEELDRLRLSIEDIYDKTFHLYDRVRKRVGTPKEETPAPNGETVFPDRKAEIRARARAAGVYR